MGKHLPYTHPTPKGIPDRRRAIIIAPDPPYFGWVPYLHEDEKSRP